MELVKQYFQYLLKTKIIGGYKMRKFQLKLFICALFALFLCACSSIQETQPNIIPDAESVQGTLSVHIYEVPKVMETSPNTLMNANTSAELSNQVMESKMIQSAKADCLDCGGVGKIPCPPCGKTGRTQCQQCEGVGCTLCCQNGLRMCVCSESAGCNNCGGKGYKDCTTCNGSGMIACENCNSSNKNSAVQETKAISTQTTNGENVANSEDGIHLCSECEGEGRTGICSNCKGDGYDKNTKQICVVCLTTGKNLCDVCDGYGMLDSNGKGVATSDTPVVNRNQSNNFNNSLNNTSRRKCSDPECVGGKRKCDVCGGGGLVERIQTAPYFGGYRKKAQTTFKKCTACKNGYVDCLRCIDGWIYN